MNAHIGQYSHGNIMNHEPVRRRKLLLHRAEIRKAAADDARTGLTLVPTKLYLKNGLIKVELAVGKGKKLHDKRESEREREMKAEARAAMAAAAKRIETNKRTTWNQNSSINLSSRWKPTRGHRIIRGSTPRRIVRYGVVG